MSVSVRARSQKIKTFGFDSWKDFTLMITSKGNMLHNKTGTWRFIKPVYEDKIPSCQNSCPCGNDIEGWIKLIRQKEYEKACLRLKTEEPFPAILGRVCFRFCEAGCNRGAFDSCVSIRELERFLGDMSMEKIHPPLQDYNGKKLAVIGSGPAGMSVAYFARVLGFEVTIFEKEKAPGGILRFGIPSYRLPKNIVDSAFNELEHMGISVKTKTCLGKDIKIEEIDKKFDYLFLGTGVQKSMNLMISGHDKSSKVMSGLDMLKQISFGEKPGLGKKVAVIGGGNTAIDAARCAVRLGCDVTIIYRRSEEEMPAHKSEIEDARDEGVKFQFLAAPSKIVTKENKEISKLVLNEMELKEPDESGRKRPVPKSGAEFYMDVDSVITAIGEEADFNCLGGKVKIAKSSVVTDDNFMADCPDIKIPVFAGGDIADIPHTVVHAVASGKRAAIFMDCHLKNKDPYEIMEEIKTGDGGAVSFAAYLGLKPVNPVFLNRKKVIRPENIVYDYFIKSPKIEKDVLSPEKRKNSFEEYEQVLTEDKAQKEAERCLHCGRCTQCNNCLIFCPDVSILFRQDGTFGYEIDYNYCKGCGICSAECPRDAITMISEEAKIPMTKEA